MSSEMGGARAKRCVPILLLGLDACPGLAIVSAALPAARHGRLEGSSGARGCGPIEFRVFPRGGHDLLELDKHCFEFFEAGTL